MSRATNTSAAESADRKSAHTRERIVDAAAVVLSRNGYARTHLTDIAELAEIQAPSIYYYFSSRDDLVAEVVSVGLIRMRAQVLADLRAMPRDADAVARIMTATAAHLRFVLGQRNYSGAAIRNRAHLPEHVQARQLEQERRYGETWRALLGELDRAGVLRPELDPTSARMLVLGALNWAAEWWDPERGSIDQVVLTAQTIIANGLCTAPVEPLDPPRGTDS